MTSAETGIATVVVLGGPQPFAVKFWKRCCNEYGVLDRGGAAFDWRSKSKPPCVPRGIENS